MSEDDKNNQYYLELSVKPVKFEPVSKVTSVFFDDSNGQVFAVRSGGAAGVVVKSQKNESNFNFRIADKGEIISIKFSYDFRVLAIQRCRTAVDFYNFSDAGLDDHGYAQQCKGKNTEIHGFCWTKNHDIIFICDNGMEYYQVNGSKKSLKLQKSFAVAINWYLWEVNHGLLLLSSGVLGNIFNVFMFNNGHVSKLPKFEIEVSSSQRASMRLCINASDVMIACLYNEVYLAVVRHVPLKSNTSGGAVINLHHINRDGGVRRTHALHLQTTGRFAMNTVDNLVVVHHQTLKTSVIFDIKQRLSYDHDHFRVEALLPAQPIKPYHLHIPVVPGASGSSSQDFPCELYSPNWIVFHPNYIIDAKLGCLWSLHFLLDPVTKLMKDQLHLVDFLLHRHGSKHTLLHVCRRILSPGSDVGLGTVAVIFDKINKAYADFLMREMEKLVVEGASGIERPEPRLQIIDQSDLYTNVFIQVADLENMDQKLLISLLVEYIRSLCCFDIPVQHYFYELLINKLVHNKCFYHLHQFLQYHVVTDSKPLACLLLSLEGTYPPAFQLALDMLKRLSTADEEIIEVLLSKQEVVAALRFARGVGKGEQLSARKFLDAAKNTSNKDLFFNVFKFFQDRNVQQRGDASFLPGDHCDSYVTHFNELFQVKRVNMIPE